jgi:hypothetical protein
VQFLASLERAAAGDTPAPARPASVPADDDIPF